MGGVLMTVPQSTITAMRYSPFFASKSTLFRCKRKKEKKGRKQKNQKWIMWYPTFVITWRGCIFFLAQDTALSMGNNYEYEMATKVEKVLVVTFKLLFLIFWRKKNLSLTKYHEENMINLCMAGVRFFIHLTMITFVCVDIWFSILQSKRDASEKSPDSWKDCRGVTRVRNPDRKGT